MSANKQLLEGRDYETLPLSPSAPSHREFTTGPARRIQREIGIRE